MDGPLAISYVPSRMPDRRVTAAAFLGAIFWCGMTSAQPAEEAIHLALESAAPCPSQPEFEHAVRQRTGSWASVRKEKAQRGFHVSLSGEGRAWTGRLRIDSDGEPPSTRTVSGHSCDEVAEAMALIVAFAIDPRATLLPTEPESKPEPVEEPVREVSRDAVVEEKPRVKVDEGRIVAPETSRWRLGIGAQVAAQAGQSPGILWTLPPFLELQREGPGVPDPVFRMSVGRGADETETSGAAARFTWTYARAEGCAAWDAGELRLVPCGMVEGGALRGAGRHLDSPRAETRPWFVLGVLGRVQWLVTPGLFLEAQGNVGASLVRDRFYLEPNATVHEVPSLTWGGAIGMGAIFP